MDTTAFYIVDFDIRLEQYIICLGFKHSFASYFEFDDYLRLLLWELTVLHCPGFYAYFIRDFYTFEQLIAESYEALQLGTVVFIRK